MDFDQRANDVGFCTGVTIVPVVCVTLCLYVRMKRAELERDCADGLFKQSKGIV